tara:strand:- start:14 stop:250 length:237 start_codon:yes stop_codon:yes gene_type:complete
MVLKVGKYWIFYRHFLYGSAIAIGTIIGSEGNISNLIVQIFLFIATLLMSTSVFTSIVVNKYPEEFEREMKERDINEI